MTSTSFPGNLPLDLDVSETEALLAAQAQLMHVDVRPARVMVRGSGSYLWDHTGARYLDFVQGWAVNALGHAPPEVSAALLQQSQTLISASPAFHNAPQLRFASVAELDVVEAK